MILGVYWYFGFPEGLYSFDHFEFKKGYGGHADNPAMLMANVTTNEPDKVIQHLRSFMDQHPEGELFVYKDNHKLRIGTGGHNLYDYDFLLIKEVENFLKNEKVTFHKDLEIEDAQFIRLSVGNNKAIIYPKRGFLQVVGSPLRKCNAETSALRMDCHLSIQHKANFIADLAALSQSMNLNVFFYREHNFLDRTNLMLFFTNGRQGLNFQEKQYVDITRFENGVEELLHRHNALLGHEGGYARYPQDGPIVERIVDREYVLD
ncbi:hypothetical protein [Chryseolinea soli]|uniref:Uncharacterized protein n=1 Tax=Chryseolinea soli TaxID=2321403 RepID=A0A385SXN5_9BACT|nr:hypothetical protein [Chryseolinea soli]AYB35121.1 hypothetical protein D4L85_33075 [Chryseolinea soli]